MAKTSEAGISPAAKAAAKKWRRGVDAFLDEFEPVVEEVRNHARTMPHETADDSEAVVAFTVDRFQKFAQERRERHAQGE